MKKWMLFLTIVLLMIAGCGKEADKKSETEEKKATEQDVKEKEPATENNKPVTCKGYVFQYKDTQICMDMEAASVIEALGEPSSYFEAPSCAFEGLDKTYNYGSFEIDTYEQNGKDFISCIYFCDDLIETPEGVTLFESKTDIISAYGENYKEEQGMLVYEKEGMKLKFLLEGEEITSIQYVSSVLEVQ